MRNTFKVVLFIVIFLVLFEIFSYYLLPGNNVKKYGSYNVSAYEVLGEEEDTIDVVALGDSLVYSSLSPMEIWNKYGYTTFDCAQAAQIIPDAVNYLDYALQSQHPKIILMEANILFRDPSKRKWMTYAINEFVRFMPIYQYHNNWKKYVNIGSKENWLNADKGFNFITKTKGVSNSNYMNPSKKSETIPNGNMDYFNKIINLANEYNAKLILVSFPSRTSWSYKKHNTTEKVAAEYGLEFIDLNLTDLGIDWKKETKDKGSHLNYKGAKKVTNYIADYLHSTNMLEDHRNDPKYNSWHIAYEQYSSHLLKD